jgi:nucleotide-binding universal stress UspA family protein/hemerythrin-like domain-containing protein
MYRHLLVPIDGSDVSTELVGSAVEYARGTGARITFFHAQPDHAASLAGEADVVRLVAPADYAYAFKGRARELLAKAESAARALGVPCESRTTVASTAHRAIVAAAREHGCDLIYMASRGRRTSMGMMLGSQTLRVLIHADVPVLVSSSSAPGTAARAIGIIRDEHRSIAAALHAWMHLLAVARREGSRPDAARMRAIVHYLRDFPVALHHPKEDEHLFGALRRRTSQLDAELQELERQHARDRELVAGLEALVERVAAGKSDATELEEAVSRYAVFIWEHLGREEGVILPAAQRHLTEQDWAQVEAAFSGNRDPRFGGDAEAEFRRLFSSLLGR